MKGAIFAFKSIAQHFDDPRSLPEPRQFSRIAAQMSCTIELTSGKWQIKKHGATLLATSNSL
jgi:hypothetical protein